MSVFVAIDLDEPVRSFVTSLIGQHAAHVAKWLPPEKLHLTLVFLGNPEPQRRAEVRNLSTTLRITEREFTVQRLLSFVR